MSRCRSCRAPIVWVTVRPSGKRMPLDPEPDPEGNVAADLDEGVAVVLGEVDVEKARAAGVTRYRSHFVTCPHAGKWRQ